MDPTIIIGAVIALVGPSGIIWLALRFNREDARVAVETMKEVSSELRLELERAHRERESLEASLGRANEERARLETALETAYEQRGLLEHRIAELTAETTRLSALCDTLSREVTLLRESNEAGR